MLVTWKGISTALGLWVGLTAASTCLADAPGRNQQTADAVAAALRVNPALASSPVRIEVRSGIVTLSGAVSEASLKAEATARTRGVPGVVDVVDRLSLVDDGRVQRAQYQPSRPTQVALGMHGGRAGVMAGGATVMGGEGIVGAAPGPVVGDVGVATDGPLPEGPAIPGAAGAAQPGYPNYAWPSYAPHPNFSAVGYPTVYPWQAWPNIGPFYPYPEVPLDWRAVTLRWDDGLWWLDFRKHYTRPFFTPYPFGIFGY